MSQLNFVNHQQLDARTLGSTYLDIEMSTYSDRYHALCGIIDNLPPSPGEVDNRFQLGVASGSDTRSYILDHFLSTARSRKGKEVDKYGMSCPVYMGDELA